MVLVVTYLIGKNCPLLKEHIANSEGTLEEQLLVQKLQQIITKQEQQDGLYNRFLEKLQIEPGILSSSAQGA